MPTTAISLLILVVAVLPGVPGDKVYRSLLGWDWREQPWQRLVRLIGFSLFGLALYTSLGLVLPFPLPLYLSPTRITEAFANPDLLPPMFAALIGHFTGSGLAGLAAAFSGRILGRWTLLSQYSSSWDHFVHQLVPGRWVIVTLDSAHSYCGMLEIADTSVREDERDLILLEPGEFDEETGQYLALEHQYLFLPGRLVSSVAAVHDPHKDRERLTQPGASVFGGGP